VEASPATTYTVNFPLADAADPTPNDGVCDVLPDPFVGDQCTLRAAIQTANGAAGPDTVIVPAGTYTLTLAGADDAAAVGDLDITDSLTFTGAGAGATTIHGGAGWDDRLFFIGTGDVVTMTGFTLSDGNSGGVAGGAVYNQGTLTLNDSRVTANTSGAAGGGLANFGQMTINRSAITGNGGVTASGLYNAPAGTLTLNDSSITGNTTSAGANDGGGIVNNTNHSLTIQNSTISGNTASGDGGGIANWIGTLILRNVTVAGNTASAAGGSGNGGGLYNELGTITAENSLIAGNADGSEGSLHPDCSGTLDSGGYNLVGSSLGCSLTGTLTGNVLDVDAKLSPLASLGLTAAHGLLPGSPALDAGNPAAPGSGGGACLAADPRGLPRPRDGDADGAARCDIGALEVRAFRVDSPNDAVDASPGNDLCATGLGECTLRAAVQEANALAGLDHVVLPFGTYTLSLNPAGLNDAASGDLNVTSDLAVAGDGAETTIIQAAGGWLERIFRIEGVYAQIAGVTIRNGGRNFSSTPDCGSAAGGGICNNGTLTMLDSVLRDNRGLSNGGGGIYSTGTLTLSNTSVYSNTGGGVYSRGALTILGSRILSNTNETAFFGGIYSQGTLLIRDSLVASNTVTGASGGGLVAWSGFATLINTQLISNSAASWGGGLVSIGAAVTLSRTTVMSNTAGNGGGLYSQTGATILESTVAGNHATDAGGGIRVTGGTLTLERSTVSSNTVGGADWGGGGIDASGLSTRLVLTNTTLSGNRAEHHGGGLYLQSGVANLYHVTLTLNTAGAGNSGAGDGGGVWVAPANATLNLENTLLARNQDLGLTDVHPDCSGTLASQGFNLIGEDSGCAVTAVLGDRVGTGAAPLNPRLGPLAGNGGPTQTHGLREGSPALEGANPATCAATDQRGVTRPAGAGCDIGAYEGVLPEPSPARLLFLALVFR
jgi:CSLREA domain-containing protein